MKIFTKTNQPKLNSNRSGFTLIELMVVIAVLVILVSISAVSYRIWRSESAKNAATSDLNGLASGMENYRNWNDGYPVLANGTVFNGGASTADIFKPGNNNTLTYVSGDKDGYCAEATSTIQSDITLHLNVSNGNQSIEEGDC